MCDPLIGGVIAGIASLATGFMNYSAQQDAMNKQEEANAAWVAYQRRQSQEAWAKDVENRQRASAAQQETLGKIGPEQQKEQQHTEEARLTNELTSDTLKQSDQAIAGDLLLSGQTNASQEFQQGVSGRVAQAAADARARIAALAGIQSYGGSQFGLANTVGRAFQHGNELIDFTGNLRRGDLAAYNVSKQVEPLRYQATGSPLGGIANALGSIAGRGISTGAGFGFG